MSRFVRKYESIVIYNIQKNKITIVLIIDAREGLFRKVQSAGKTAQNEDKKGKKNKEKNITTLVIISL